MASSTTNLDLILPVGGEHVSRQITNANNVKIDEAVGPVPSGTDLQSQVTALNSNIAIVTSGTRLTSFSDIGTFLTGVISGMVENQYKFVRIMTGDGSSLYPFTSWTDYIGWVQKQNNTGTYWSGFFVARNGYYATVGCDNGTISGDSINSKYVIEHKTKAGGTVNANAAYDFDFDVTKAGYNAVGVVGTTINSGGSCCLVSSYPTSNTGVRVRIRNTGTSAVTTGSIEVKVLYEKA